MGVTLGVEQAWGSVAMDETSVPDRKQALRTALLADRKEESAEQLLFADRAIACAVQALPAFAASELVLSYCSFGREVDTMRIIEDALKAGKRVALPRIVGPGNMVWHEISCLEGLVRSSWGIMEPAPESAPELKIALLASAKPIALVPGLAFDGRGFRLGYGGGYYDRFLPGFRAAGGFSIGLCREIAFQEQELPHDGYDVPVDAVITESRTCLR